MTLGGPRTSREIPYPTSPMVAHVDVRHGIEIPDPYRWLEDLEAPATNEWVRAQNALTEGVLSSVPARASIAERLRALRTREEWGALVAAGEAVFGLWNDGTMNQPVLCVFSRDGRRSRVLVDPNEWSDVGAQAILAFVPSNDGRLVAFGTAVGGSDWTRWRVSDVASGALLEDRIERIRFSAVTWFADGSGFFYSAFGDDGRARVHAHRLGERQRDDRLVYERPDRPILRFQPIATRDGRWLVVHEIDQTNGPNAIVCVDTRTDEVVPAPDAYRARFTFTAQQGERLLFVSDLHSPRGTLLAFDPRRPDRWETVIPETEEPLRWASRKGDALIAEYLVDARSSVRRLAGGAITEVPLPGIGWAGGFGGDPDDPETPFLFMGFTQPPAPYLYDAGGNRVRPFVGDAPRAPDGIVARQIFYEASDGVTIPMFLVHRADLSPDGACPTLLRGYGGFGIPIVPWYWPLAVAWVERGGLFAAANIRGGGEYGDAWHLAGSGPNKQRSFDDFLDAATWLMDEGYTAPEKLAISGASNGGLLVGACITQRPELFAAAHIEIGLLDMMALDRVGAGLTVTEEFGHPHVAEDVVRLLTYSPLQNLRPGVRYPATIVVTGDHDELLPPWHSYKFAAALQAAQGGDARVLLRVEPDSGHGNGRPVTKAIAEETDVLTFLLDNLGAL